MKQLSKDWAFATPPQLAELLGIDSAKLHSWIALGELKAANTATNTTSRPLYRVARRDFDHFWQARSSSSMVV